MIVRRAGEEIATPIVLRLDEARFLKDHCLGRDVSLADRGLSGLPIVPLTMTMEILAEAACALAPGRVVTGMREVRGHRWLTLPEGEIRMLAVARRRPGAGEETVEVRLHAAPEGDGEAQGALLAEAVIVLGRSAAVPPEAGPFDLRAARPSRWESERLYREGMFHGAAFQGVVSMDRWGEDGAEATLRVPAASDHFADRRQPHYVADPVLLDLPGQVVGFWTAEHLDRGYVVFPFRLERLDLFGDRAKEGETFSCRARIALEGEGQVRSDLDVVAADGTLRARLEGWWDRRFDLPRPFARLLLSPVDAEVGDPWPLETGGVFNLEDYRGCQIDAAAFPEGLFTSLDGFWAEVLARVVLGSDERRQW
ncbi:MAG: polyketide synthase dehydratase domain-containing protein, partial [Planctomycetes bacterium]|nr:polyketide synthase dehydratase domain-containing protein [Planctomycetota bacterium]